VVENLIAHLGPEKHEENNLNASTIIQDVFEQKEFFNIICQKENLKAIADFASKPLDESTRASKTAALTVLCGIVGHHIEKAKKSGKKDDSKPENDDDDDMIVQQNSDDEKEDEQEPSSIALQAAVISEVLAEIIPDLVQVLKSTTVGDMTTTSVQDGEYVPLGQQRLWTVELVLKMIQLKKDTLNFAIAASDIPKNTIGLVKEFPWNNFLQLKVINIFTEVLELNDNVAFTKEFLESSTIAASIVDMQARAKYEMESTRIIRNGFMALVVNISNKL